MSGTDNKPSVEVPKRDLHDLATLALSAFGIVLVIFGYFISRDQLDVMRQQMWDAKWAAADAMLRDIASDEQQSQLIDINRRLAKAAADDAGSNRIIAEQTTRQAREFELATRRQLRPYLTVRPSQVTDLVAGMAPRWRVDYEHSGASPAFDASLRIWSAILPHPFKSDPTALIVLPPDGSYRAVVSSGTQRVGGDARFICREASVPARYGCPLTAEEAATVTAPDSGLRLYMFGVVDYRDSYGRSYVTPFCHYWDPVSQSNAQCVRTRAPT